MSREKLTSSYSCFSNDCYGRLLACTAKVRERKLRQELGEVPDLNTGPGHGLLPCSFLLTLTRKELTFPHPGQSLDVRPKAPRAGTFLSLRPTSPGQGTRATLVAMAGLASSDRTPKTPARLSPAAPAHERLSRSLIRCGSCESSYLGQGPLAKARGKGTRSCVCGCHAVTSQSPWRLRFAAPQCRRGRERPARGVRSRRFRPPPSDAPWAVLGTAESSWSHLALEGCARRDWRDIGGGGRARGQSSAALLDRVVELVMRSDGMAER